MSDYEIGQDPDSLWFYQLWAVDDSYWLVDGFATEKAARRDARQHAAARRADARKTARAIRKADRMLRKKETTNA